MGQRMITAAMYVAAIVFLNGGGAQACSTPVFRYALENWSSENYQLFVFHEGPLKANEQNTLQVLNRLCRDEDNLLNMSVHPVNVAETMNPVAARVWQNQGKEALPRAVLCFPDARAMAWAGAFDAELPVRLAHSPARLKLVKWLAGGTSIVFVFLETGNRDVDTKACSFLREELAKLQESFQFPPADDEVEEPTSRRKLNLPLKLSFEILRIAPDDAAEQVFREMLLKSDSKVVTGKPTVFPVFGRGRALGGMTGADLNAENLDACVSFLARGCSCQVKELNPGVDVLLTANWEQLFETAVPQEKKEPAPAHLKPASVLKSAPVAVAIPPGTVANTPSETFSSRVETADIDLHPWLWGATAIAGILVLITGGLVFRKRFGNSSGSER